MTASTSSSSLPAPTRHVVQQRLKAVTKRQFPTADVLNQQELKDNQEKQVDTLLNLIYALLSLAVITSLFGIANTLALSIHERTRELGMLRAIGMSRRQVRRMIRYEAVITALIGALLGLVLGVIFAALVSRPLADEGFTLSYPIGDADPAAGAGRDRRRRSRRSGRPAAPPASTCSRRSPTNRARSARPPAGRSSGR